MSTKAKIVRIIVIALLATVAFVGVCAITEDSLPFIRLVALLMAGYAVGLAATRK